MAMQKGQIAPRTMTGGLRAKAWWVLRKNRCMTLAELMLTVCTGSERNAETNLRRWLNKLVNAGFLTRERINDGKPTSNGSFRYALVKDWGPKAPVVRESADEIFDPNSGRVAPLNSQSSNNQAKFKPTPKFVILTNQLETRNAPK